MSKHRAAGARDALQGLPQNPPKHHAVAALAYVTGYLLALRAI